MTDSEDEGADFSNVLLAAVNGNDDVFSFNEPSKPKKQKGARRGNGEEETTIDDGNFLTSDVSTKTKLNGASFKNMGN